MWRVVHTIFRFFSGDVPHFTHFTESFGDGPQVGHHLQNILGTAAHFPLYLHTFWGGLSIFSTLFAETVNVLFFVGCAPRSTPLT